MRNTTGNRLAGFGLGLTLLAALSGCTGAPPRTTPPVSADAGTLRLVAFSSCRQALRELQAAARPYVGPYGFASGTAGLAADGGRGQGERAAAAPGREESAPEHSTTNVHEAGVDEPDLVKTDGRRIVTVVGGVLRVIDVASRKQTGMLRVSETGMATQFLMYGDRALVVISGHVGYADVAVAPGGTTAAQVPGIEGTELVLVDLSAEPTVASRMKLDGGYVDARMVGGVVRMVTRSVPRVPFRLPAVDTSPVQAQRDNFVVLGRTTIDDWLPRYEIDDGRTVSRGRVPCGQVTRPVTYSGTSMLTVLSLDLAAGALSADRSVSIVADGSTVYGTGEHLYVANDQRFVRPFQPSRRESRPPRPRTEVYKFDVSGPGAPRHTASGVVPGWLLNQYAMSEHDGHLRLATTTGELWGGGDRPRTESAVYVLAHEGSRLVQIGHVGGLGKGERIYAVRFAGPVGYVVTFRRVDPLYVVDLRDPERPRVTGELKITGYSAYLHPAGEGRLIGVGQEASERGRRLGLQVSLFDVSDPAAPTRVAQHHVRYGHSAAEFDPHAFLYWPKTGLLVIPVLDRGAEPVDGDAEPVTPQGGALVLKVSDGGLTELGTVQHPNVDYRGMVQRSLIIDGTLWTVSQAGVQANHGETLKQQVWVPFR